MTTSTTENEQTAQATALVGEPKAEKYISITTLPRKCRGDCRGLLSQVI